MHRRQKRFAIFGTAMALGLLLFALAAVAARPWLQWSAAALALAAFIGYLARGDEVERLLALRASGFAFFSTLAGLLAMALLPGGEFAAAMIEHAWAASMAFWLTGWVVFRVRLG